MVTRGDPKLMRADDMVRILSNIIGPQPQVYLAFLNPSTSELIGGPWESAQNFVQNPAKGTGEVVIVTKSLTQVDVINDIIKELFDLIIAIPGIGDLLLNQVPSVAKVVAKVIIERYGWGPGK